MTDNISLESTNADFSRRASTFRGVDAANGVHFERDGAAFRFSAPTPNEIRIFELTTAPTFLAFNRDGATLYEPTLSAEAAPVYSPTIQEITPTSPTPTPFQRENRRRAANLATALRTRVYFPAFLEKELASKTIGDNDLTLAKLSPLRIGDRIAAFWNRASGRFEAVESSRIDVLRFKTTGPLMSFGTPNALPTAAAVALYYDAENDAILETSLTLTVADHFWKHFGAAVGSVGFAKRFGEHDRWEILSIYSITI